MCRNSEETSALEDNPNLKHRWDSNMLKRESRIRCPVGHRSALMSLHVASKGGWARIDRAVFVTDER